MLIFKDHGVGCRKWYARTSNGEFAFSDTQGLYQWHDGHRIQFTGGDRQHSSDGRMWHFGDETLQPTPAYLGFVHALHQARWN